MSWSGISDFDAYLLQARTAAEASAKRVCQESADELVARVKRSVPKGDPRGGHLQDSVHSYQKDDHTVAVKIGSEAMPYAAALEFGHAAPDGSRVPAQKVFFPNVRVVNKKHGRKIRRQFRKAIKDNGVV